MLKTLIAIFELGQVALRVTARAPLFNGEE
jgi:hypothetical protein